MELRSRKDKQKIELSEVVNAALMSPFPLRASHEYVKLTTRLENTADRMPSVPASSCIRKESVIRSPTISNLTTHELNS